MQEVLEIGDPTDQFSWCGPPETPLCFFSVIMQREKDYILISVIRIFSSQEIIAGSPATPGQCCTARIAMSTWAGASGQWTARSAQLAFAGCARRLSSAHVLTRFVLHSLLLAIRAIQLLDMIHR